MESVKLFVENHPATYVILGALIGFMAGMIVGSRLADGHGDDDED